MPIEYTLAKNGSLVMATASGALTLDCFLSMQEKMKADTDLINPHDTLLDARTITSLEVNEKDLAVIADGIISGPKRLGINRLAIVTDRELGFTLGNKYQKNHKDVVDTVIVFFNIDIAHKWLGIKNDSLEKKDSAETKNK
jgi:hypothetical protein